MPIQPLLPESLARSLLPGTEYQKQLLAAQGQLQSGTTELQAELLQSQARLAELETQVRAAGPLPLGAGLRWEGTLRVAGSFPRREEGLLAQGSVEYSCLPSLVAGPPAVF